MFMSKNKFISHAMVKRERRHEHCEGYAHVIHKLSEMRNYVAQRTPVVSRWEALAKKMSKQDCSPADGASLPAYRQGSMVPGPL